jgi:nondiscriminating aspartyl-tRNA synthetase
MAETKLQERVWTSDLAAHTDGRVRLAGWLHHQRQLSQRTFLVLRDRTGLAQVVVEQPEQLALLGGLPNETVLSVEGTVVANAQAPAGVEVVEPTIDVLVEPAEPPPIELRRPELKEQLPTILDHAAVALRHPKRRAAFQIMAAALAGYRQRLGTLGFTEISTPKIVAGATESGATVFRIDYFGRDAYLAQSPQLYKQIMVGVFERVFEVGPVFRAEPHDTPRHLSEYTSLDAEIGFIESHRTVMGFAREAMDGMLSSIASTAGDALTTLDLTLPTVPDEIPYIHFSEAQRLIEADTGESLAGEPDLAPAHERWLGEWSAREHGSEFLFVEGYPLAKRPFYTHPQPDDPTFANGFDLLFRGLELITGGQRLHRYDDYVEALRARALPTEPFEGYLEAFRYGMPPHGGFAIGLERLVARLVGAANVRETTLFPRDLNRLTP